MLIGKLHMVSTNILEDKNIFPLEVEIELKKWLSRYSFNQKKSILIPALHILQDYNSGYLTVDLLDKLALYLSVKTIWVYEVVKFYTMFSLKPMGCHKIDICDNISCMLSGAKNIINFIENTLCIKVGETTQDGKITLRTVECQGSCCSAPVLLVDKIFYDYLTINKVKDIIKNLE